jgi:uncharacterized membrane protein
VGGRGDWYVAGWWRISAHQCQILGSFARPTIYLHAENAKGRLWNGIDARLCVQSSNFRYIYSAADRCNGTIAGFYQKVIDPAWESFEWRVGQ